MAASPTKKTASVSTDWSPTTKKRVYATLYSTKKTNPPCSQQKKRPVSFKKDWRLAGGGWWQTSRAGPKRKKKSAFSAEKKRWFYSSKKKNGFKKSRVPCQ